MSKKALESICIIVENARAQKFQPSPGENALNFPKSNQKQGSTLEGCSTKARCTWGQYL